MQLTFWPALKFEISDNLLRLFNFNSKKAVQKQFNPYNHLKHQYSVTPQCSWLRSHTLTHNT